MFLVALGLLCLSARLVVATPKLGDTISVGGETLSLTWQDEFNEPVGTRSFGPGEDPVWEGVDLWYQATWDDEVYKPGNAKVADGHLKVTLSDTPSWDRHNRRMHKFTSAMLQSWNKVCYTGGYFEVRAKLPGGIDKGGQWAAVWMAGNLGRPGRLDSTAGVWPYSYNKCDGGEGNQWGLDDGTKLTGQRITACDPNPGFGLNPNQGRGMPEFDVLEVAVPTNGVASGKNVHLTTSLQMGPIIPKDTNFGPGPTGCDGHPSDRTLYEQCESFTYFHDQPLDVQPTQWCMAVEHRQALSDLEGREVSDRGSYLQDCLSAEVDLAATHFDDFHTYGVLWEPKERIVWFVDGKPVYQIRQSALEAKLSSVNPDFFVGERDIPTEPMSLVINLAISDGGFLQWNREHQWPLEFEIDSVRIYQDASRGHSLSCSPASHPTADYITAHPGLYGLPVCGNGKCDDGECITCPGDCHSNMACPASHIDGVPSEGDEWQIAHDVASCPGTCGALGLGCCLTGDCCTAINGGPIGCAVGDCGEEAGCELSFTADGMRLRARGAKPCMVRRTGLLPDGPLQETKASDFSLTLDAAGTGSFSYALTIGPHGNMCDPAHSDCKSILVKQDPDETELCANCAGHGVAPGMLYQRLGRIDLTFRFPYFLGPQGGAIKITVEPGADILFRSVRFGPFLPPMEAVPMTVTRRGFWASVAACNAVAAASACDNLGVCHSCGDRLAWLTSPNGGAQSSDIAKITLASEFSAECGACDTSVVHPFNIHGTPTPARTTTGPISATTVTTTLDQPNTTTTLAEHSPACDAHPRCSGLAGDCCPTSSGLQLGCCDQVDGSTTATTVATTTTTAAAAATATTTTTTTTTTMAGPAPTTDRTIGTTTTTTTTTLTQPSTTVTKGDHNAACNAHPRCSGLAGDCCPTSAGLQLGCCDQIDSSTTATATVTTTTTTFVTQSSNTTTRGEYSPACSAHPRCGGLAGDCCPTSSGVHLGCCEAEATAPHMTDASETNLPNESRRLVQERRRHFLESRPRRA